MNGDTRSRRPSRRDFLKGLGATGAGLVAGSMSAGAPAEAATAAARPGRHPHGHGAPTSSVDFGRIFPHLPPFAEASDTVRAALFEVGKPGGILDARDQLSAGPKALIVDPTVNGNPTATNSYGTNPDNPTMTAGSTFVGQFVDHDITFDQTSQLGMPQNPVAVAQHAHARAGSRFGVRRRARHAARSVRAERGWVGGTEAEGRHRRRARGRAACAER